MDATIEISFSPVVSEWTERISGLEAEQKRIKEGAEALSQALVPSIRYLKERREGKQADPSREAKISISWSHAADKVRPLDGDTASRCYLKALHWLDPLKGNDSAHIEQSIHSMEEALFDLRNRRLVEEVLPWRPTWGNHFLDRHNPLALLIGRWTRH